MQNYRSAYAGKVVLVTGGAGSIGSNLCRALAEVGAQVIILDDFSASVRWNVPSLPEILLVEGDILDEVKLKRVFLDRPQIVFHLAAFFANQNSVDHPQRDLMVNGLGTLLLLQYSVLAGVERFLYASSGSAFYDAYAPLPLKEEGMSLHLGTPYQITKLLGELYCNFYFHFHGLHVVKLRFFNSYGPGEVPGQYRNVIPNFIYWGLKGMPLPITGSGEETRDFTYVSDIVDGLLRAGIIDSAVGQEFNLASGLETPIIDLAYMVNHVTGNPAGIRFVQRRRWDAKSRRLACIDRAHQLLGYQPAEPLEMGLRKTVDWFQEHWKEIQVSASFGPGISTAARDALVETREVVR